MQPAERLIALQQSLTFKLACQSQISPEVELLTLALSSLQSVHICISLVKMINSYLIITSLITTSTVNTGCCSRGKFLFHFHNSDSVCEAWIYKRQSEGEMCQTTVPLKEKAFFRQHSQHRVFIRARGLQDCHACHRAVTTYLGRTFMPKPERFEEKGHYILRTQPQDCILNRFPATICGQKLS